MSTHRRTLDRIGVDDAHTLAGYRKLGGYRALDKVLTTPLTPAAVIEEVKSSGLRGRGGAGFATGLKWSFMPDPAKDPRKRYMAVNADESEPGTCKDRVLMTRDPHGLVEGCMIAAYAMRLDAVYIYVRGEYRESHDRVAAAVAEARAANLVGKNVLGTDFSCEIPAQGGRGVHLRRGDRLMEAWRGSRPKPPFPAGFGLWGQPTTVNNVETIQNVPFILERGASWFRSMGTEKSPGNFLCCISGHVEKPGVYELPLGIPAREVLERWAGGVWKGRKLKAWMPGGSSTGFLLPTAIDARMDHDSIKAAGSMFGTGAMIILDETASIVRAAMVLMRFYEHESCGQCSQCREGTEWLAQIFERIFAGHGRMEDIQLLTDLANGMAPGKTICALSDAAAIPTHSVVKHFRAELEEYVRLGGHPGLRKGSARTAHAEVSA